MQFSLNFIKEFLELNSSAQEVARRLTSSGTEVEHLEKSDGDWVFNIEVTSNRYDLLSILGIAREIGACTNKKLKIKYPAILKKPLIKDREIIIENTDDCPFYLGRLIRKVKVFDSPSWLCKSVSNCAINSINNVVDITNYCMLKWGNPLHAFDEDKIQGNVHIRRAKEKEVFFGIDEKERALNKENLVIADDKKVIALAGVMGTKNTEVDKNTKNIFLEAAIFSPLTVRRSRRAVGLDTESAYRFERKVNADYLEFASMQASKLIEELGKGEFFGYKEAGRKPSLNTKRITIATSALSAYLGADFQKKEVRKVLENLDFGIKLLAKDKICVSVPSFRFDIQREVDVYEEFARIQGYEKIKPKIPQLVPKPPEETSYAFKEELRKNLAAMGLNEVITYSIEAEEDLKVLNLRKIIKILNPLRKQEDTLRPSLLGGMIKSVRYNLNRNQTNLRFFELANVYLKKENGFCEPPHLSIAFSGEQNNFFSLKGMVEEFFDFLGIKDFNFKEENLDNFNNALKIIIRNVEVGFLGKLNEKLKDAFDLKEDLFFCELDLNSLKKEKKERLYTPFSQYPLICRDISTALSRKKMFSQIREIVESQAKKYLSDLRITDIYRGKDLPKDCTAFTLRVYYQSKDETLTAQFVDSLHNKIRDKLSSSEGITLR